MTHAESVDRPKRRTAGNSQGFIVIFLTTLPTMAIVSLVPNLPLLFQQFGRLPNAGLLIPMVLTIPSLCIALVSPLMGAASDRWGRRPVLLCSLLLFVAVGIVPAFTGDLHTLLLTRFPVGIAEAGIMAAQNALLGDYFEGRERERWLGRMSILSPIFGALLVLAGGALGSISWRAPFLLYLLGAPLLVWALVSVFEPEHSSSTSVDSAPPAVPSSWKQVLLVAAVTLGIAILYFVQAVQLGRMFGELGITSPARISVFVMLASVGVLVGGWAYPRITSSVAGRRFALVLLAYGIGYAGLGLAGSAKGALPAAWIAQFGNGIAIPVMIGWSLQQFDSRRRGAGMGTWAACFFAGSFLSPPFVMLMQRAAGSFLGAVFWTGVLSGITALAVLCWPIGPSSPARRTLPGAGT